MEEPRRGSRRPEAPRGGVSGQGAEGRLALLDDADLPLYSVGQAAQALGTRPAALRRLDAAGVLSPGRSSGGQRRYSRRQLERAARIQAFVADGTSAALAGHIVDLEDEVIALREQLRSARASRRARGPAARQASGGHGGAGTAGGERTAGEGGGRAGDRRSSRDLPGPRHSSD